MDFFKKFQLSEFQGKFLSIVFIFIGVTLLFDPWSGSFESKKKTKQPKPNKTQMVSSEIVEYIGFNKYLSMLTCIDIHSLEFKESDMTTEEFYSQLPSSERRICEVMAKEYEQ